MKKKGTNNWSREDLIVFQCELYGSYIVACIAWPVDEFIKFFRESAGNQNTDLSDVNEGVCINTDDDEVEGQVIYIWTRTRKPSVIAHEALHAANYILDHCGVYVTPEHDEAQTFLTEWIVSYISDND